jgi:hypothetical protein
MADFATICIAAYAGKHLKEDIEKNYDQYKK